MLPKRSAFPPLHSPNCGCISCQTEQGIRAMPPGVPRRPAAHTLTQQERGALQQMVESERELGVRVSFWKNHGIDLERILKKLGYEPE